MAEAGKGPHGMFWTERERAEAAEQRVAELESEVSLYRAALEQIADDAEQARQPLVGILRGEIPCPYPADPSEAHRRVCAVLATSRDTLKGKHLE